MPNKTLNLNDIETFLRNFAAARDWQQFHSPKNLVMALSGEAGELSELFQWLSEDQSWLKDDTETKKKVANELADILQYIVRISDLLSIDLNDALWKKLRRNEEKYPVELSKGTAKKYTEF
ncbi:NTP pyrophosphatase, house-cleaning of non-canonical NTPs [Desulforhopalus singaporensis]|uniref:NTP pyrophosphatase, house-cleaning of non-canonical NTPs n=2 Tax=Desulforhopalus singaporensis TaxID=91360 RepID=A0A1H0VIT0_9BACT|nr:NTP pyrophosphatase, house-cleaning of non-canonical NTPs [Desulforhopalus singaporensis]